MATVLRVALEFQGYDLAVAELGVALLARATVDVHQRGRGLPETHVAALRELVPLVRFVLRQHHDSV